MITRNLTKPIVHLKSYNAIVPSFLSLKLVRLCSNNNDLSNVENRQELLQSVLADINMKKTASIMLEDTEEIQRRKVKQLTKQEKLKLGLYVPKMAINPRMNINSQIEYRSQICQNLYQQQKAHLQTSVRILEKMTQSERLTIDSYINAVYKDIYARYLVNKGIGIEWNGKFSSYGVMNSNETSPSPQNLVSSFLKANIQKIQKIQSVAPYSYLTQSFVSPDFIQVENIRKIGYFLRLPLTEFGKHEKNFEKLKQKGSKIQLLVFCEFLQKMINPQCLCIIPGKKMIILKRHFIERKSSSIEKKKNEQIESETGLKFEYLITFLQVFNKHKQYFTEKSYEKHLVFESDHLVGMKAEYSLSKANEVQGECQKLQVMSQIQGYERDENVYIVNGATSIPDYERVQEFTANGGEISKLKNVLDSQGRLALDNASFQSPSNFPSQKSKQKEDKLSIIDIEFQDKLLDFLKQKIQFQELYDVFEDQVYSNKQTNELLRFRLFDKLQIPIPQESYNILDQHFSNNNTNMTIHESKVKLPENKNFKKPRQRRQYKKQVRESLKQKTQYMTLSESIRSISSIPVSSSIQGDIKVWIENDHDGDVVNVFESKSQVSKGEENTIEELTVSTDLISALTYMFNTEYGSDLNSVVIEPQTITEEILPLCLHLTLMKHKAEPVKRGRRNPKQQSSQIKRILESFKMIYLHPTIKPNQRELQVNSFIMGSMKISSKQDYGYGFEAIRLWVCRHSEYLGDRELKQREVNQELKQSSFIRKLYAELIPLAPKGQLTQELSQIEFEQMNFLDRFMQQQINAYILNMEHFYSRVMLKQAYEYTMDFFRNVVDEIFLSTVRHHVITYPNEKENLYHGATVKRLLQLLSVISPLLPFTTFHISKQQILRWPQVDNKSTFYKNLLEYNALIKIRTQLKNKLILNQFKHCEVIFPLSDQLLYTQNDLKKFFGVDKISFINPEIKEKNFGFKLRFNETLGGKTKIQIYESKDHCIRCDPDSHQKDHLCLTCTSYLETNVGKQIEFYDKRNNSLLIQGKAEQKRQIRTEKQAIQ